MWLLGLLLLAAGVEDAVRLRISNMISLAILLLAVVTAFVVGAGLDIWKNAVMCAGLLALGTLLFATGKFGGGDVKLLASTGCWVEFLGGMRLTAAVFIAGGVLALAIIAARTVAPAIARAHMDVLKSGAGIPYGIAIAAGGLITIALERLL